jgi:hypothetical protein
VGEITQFLFEEVSISSKIEVFIENLNE